LPTYVSVEQRLESEIRKMIEAGHLAPGVSTFEQHFRYDVRNDLGWNLDEYWHNPAELVYTLTLAMPHLSPALRAETRAYLEEEFERFPPSQFVHTGPEGARREYNGIPPEYASDWPERYGQLAEPATRANNWAGWSFPPFNIYACAKYAEIFPEKAKNILGELRSKVAPPPSDVEFLRARPHVLNAHIAGYFGYLGLERMAGEAENDSVRAWLDDALRLRVELLAEGTAHLSGSEAGGFMWLTPELGEYLFENARADVERAVAEYDWAAPYWFVSNAQETTRVWPGRNLMEGYHAHIYDTMSQFQARAFALKHGRAELERRLDASSVARGDLYYIQNLAVTLAAGDGEPPPGGVRRGHERRYRLQGAGQAQ
jgi:hypothetical protein